MSGNIVQEILANLDGASSDFVLLNYVQPVGDSVDCDIEAFRRSLNAMAGHALGAGLQAGDIALVIPGHEPETVLLFLALIRLGIVPCILPYPRSSTAPQYVDSIRELADDIDAKWLVSASASVGSEWVSGDGLPEFRHFAGDLADGSELQGHVLDDCPEGEIAYLQLTSGTTGRSRAIVVTHAALRNQLRVGSQAIGATASDVFVGWLPLNHDMGLISQVFTPLWVGAKSVLIAPNHWISDPSSLLKAVDRYRGTITYMPNFGLYYTHRRMGVEDVRAFDLSSWRLIFNGAEMVRPGTVRAFNELVSHGGVERNIVAPGYGLGENVLAVSVDLPRAFPRTLWISSTALERAGEVVLLLQDDPQAIAVVSCGRPIGETEVRIRHCGVVTSRERLAGEIVIRGSSLCPRYLGRQGELIQTAEGFGTGDIGFLDEGEIFVCGRKKEIAIIAGRNINPAVVSSLAENCLGDLLRRAAAFSVESEEIGTEALIVICETSRKVPADELAVFANRIRAAVLDNLQVTVSDVVFKANNWLPRTTSGKTNIPEARKKYQREVQAARADTPASAGGLTLHDEASLEREISGIAARIARVAEVDSRRSLLEQGMDSLGAAELLMEIEFLYGVRIREQFFDEPTVSHVLEQVARQLEAMLPAHPETESKPVGNPAIPPHPYQARGGTPRLKHLIRYGPRTGGRFISYRQAYLMQARLAHMRLVRAMFRSELALVDDWRRILDSDLDPEWCRQQSLIANTWIDWRNRRLINEREYDRWVSFSFAGDFAQQRDRSRGVVVVFPHIAKLYAPLYRFVSQNLSPRVSIMRREPGKGRTVGERELNEAKARARQTWDASRVLQEGGVLMIAGDGRRGGAAVDVPFAGRTMTFQSGAAGLALRTNSYLLPVFPSIGADGRVLYEFADPVQSTVSGQEAGANDMTAQYAGLYEAHFRKAFPQFKWEFLSTFMEYLK